MRPWLQLVSKGRWYVAVALVILSVSFIAFDSYVKRTGLEIVNSWHQNEAVAIQQGNLLSAISKNQRVLLSSDFVKGISLYDTSHPSNKPLIEFGKKISTKRMTANRGKETTILRVGIFRFTVLFPIPDNPSLVAGFLIAPVFAPLLFSIYALILLAFLFTFLHRAVRWERIESKRREALLWTALNDFANHKEPPATIVAHMPRLVEAWNEMKKALDDANQKQAQLEASARFAELARQVAHDIRSPLSALKVISSTGTIEEKSALLDAAVKRISNIADTMLRRTREAHSDDAKYKGIHNTLDASQRSLTDASMLVHEIIAEKQLSLAHTPGIEIRSIFSVEQSALVDCEPTALGQTISNLVDNALDAIDSQGTVTISVSIDKPGVTIKVCDDGRGIPKDILPRLFEPGASFGKKDGNGLGLYNARECIQSWNGRLDLFSRENQGTIVSIFLPHPESNIYKQET